MCEYFFPGLCLPVYILSGILRRFADMFAFVMLLLFVNVWLLSSLSNLKHQVILSQPGGMAFNVSVWRAAHGTCAFSVSPNGTSGNFMLNKTMLGAGVGVGGSLMRL